LKLRTELDEAQQMLNGLSYSGSSMSLRILANQQAEMDARKIAFAKAYFEAPEGEKKTVVFGRATGKSTTMAKKSLGIMDAMDEAYNKPDGWGPDALSEPMHSIAVSLKKVNLELKSHGFLFQSGNIVKVDAMEVHRPHDADRLATMYVDDFARHLELNTGIKLIGHRGLDVGKAGNADDAGDATMTLTDCTFRLPAKKEERQIIGIDYGAPGQEKTVWGHAIINTKGVNQLCIAPLDENAKSGDNTPSPVATKGTRAMAWHREMMKDPDYDRKFEAMTKESQGWRGPDESKSHHQNLTDFFTHDSTKKK
jgi:hypothetical protein